ncbi:MAG: TetR family transcriptional regulator [Rhodospirillales bacterium]
MDDTDFDTALIASALTLAGTDGWRSVTVPAAARAAGLPLSQARVRFPNKAAILLGFGRMADELTLEDAPDEGPVRDRLFDLLMRRFDALQAQRSGILAVLRALPFDPCTAVLLACATRRSMRWMLQAAGDSATGLAGELHVKGLIAVWLWAVRAWEKDETEDLTVTMAALDSALSRAEQAAGWLVGRPAVKVDQEAPVGEPATE